MSAVRYPMPAVRRRSVVGRVFWWLLFMPRLFVGLTVMQIIWSIPGEHINGWWTLAGAAAFWVISPFRIRRLWAARRARNDGDTQPSWQPPMGEWVYPWPAQSAPGPAARRH